MLENTLKKVLAEVISPNQSTFISGRLITDYVLNAFEALHTMDTRMTGRGVHGIQTGYKQSLW